MVRDYTTYSCNYTSNVFTKSKKWKSGVIKARRNHGSITLFLYELNEETGSSGKLVDRFEVFNSTVTSLAGREISNGRNIVDIVGISDPQESQQVYVPTHKSGIRCGLQRRPSLAEKAAFSQSDPCKDSSVDPIFDSPLEHIETTASGSTPHDELEDAVLFLDDE